MPQPHPMSRSLGRVVRLNCLKQGRKRKADVLVGRLEVELVADDGELVVLELFEGLFLVDVEDDAGGVDHTRAKEPMQERHVNTCLDRLYEE